MELVLWEQNKNHLQRYRQRDPTASPLYRIIYNYREAFEYHYEQLFQQRYGFLRAEVLAAYDAYLNCGVLAHGCAQAVCKSCNHSQLIAFSCKRRSICPSCEAKRAHIFAENLQENVLYPLPYKHAVFTIPKRLRVYFRYDRSLISVFYQAAWGAWRDFAALQYPNARAAAVMALHTSGDLLNFHPHIHALILPGAVDESDNVELLSSIDTEFIEQRFAERIFQALLERELITDDVITSMRAWEHSGFRVWFGDDISRDDTEKRLFTARYLLKCPISLKRLEILDSALQPNVRYYKDNNKTEYKDFSPLEFMAELSQHIPNMWEQTIRFYGAHSARSRGAKRRDERFRLLLENNFEPLETGEAEKKPPSRYWAACMKRVFEIDPLKCPKCGGEMKIRAFILDYKEIHRICDNLGLPAWRAPPQFQASGVQIETELD